MHSIESPFVVMQLGQGHGSAAGTDDSARVGAMQPRGGASALRATLVLILPEMDRNNSKRKATSPCESNKIKIVNKINIANKTVTKMPESDMDTGSTKSLTYRILTRNGEDFKGALDRTMAMKIWMAKDGLNLPEKMIYGVALVQIPGKPFLFDYHLHEVVEIDDVRHTFKTKLNNDEYTGEIVLPKPIPPALGEEVEIKITRTRFKLSVEEITQWMTTFGKVTKPFDYEYAPDYTTIKCDDAVGKMTLRKHVPGLLPAFGRKMTIRYSGQPIQCGKCFQYNHIRKECENERIDWLSYAKMFLTENYATKEMLGTWVEIIKSKEQE